jgi:hypothetical protein
VGPDHGDLFVSFQWTTPKDGPLPSPEARLAVLADHDARVVRRGDAGYMHMVTTRPPSQDLPVHGS